MVKQRYIKPNFETMAVVIYCQDGVCRAFVGVHLKHGHAFTIVERAEQRNPAAIYTWLRAFDNELPTLVFVEEGYPENRAAKKGEENHA
jgi:hypothetical protein